MSGDNQSLPYRKVYTGMPVYNGERYLEQSIRCNLDQTFDDYGLIIADNASTDRTEEICRDFAVSDSRVVYIRNPQNVGAAKNYWKCFTPSNSEYFRWSNADDVIDPRLIEKCVESLDEQDDAVLAFGGTRLIDGEDQLIREYDDNLELLQQVAADRFIECRKNIGLSNVLYGLMRRKDLAKTALFGNYIASDINLIAELTLYGKFRRLPEILFDRRIHEQASSFDRTDADRQKNFWDPTKRRLFMQEWRGMMAYFSAVSRSPIPTQQKRRLYWYLSKTMYWTKGDLWSEITDYFRFGLLRRS